MRKSTNPFVISGYEGEKYFCDRVMELRQLKFEIDNGNNVALIATRRMGKSGLIQHYFSQDKVQVSYYVYDIFPWTLDTKRMLMALRSATSKQLSGYEVRCTPLRLETFNIRTSSGISAGRSV